ncbi:MAG: PhoH family protein [Mastigocoleus sp. MO_167.B18]|uniref:PhoH family protein n=1 Tax=Mastigocoleus sp. MO_188.B34 TaxID=3036635 RepID=UPI0026117B9D|nr:PhoH family protein [Mastigocoleus sp. MO_188.B34]MDJ0696510.1 PhoH family protein [Mastigocoleus sp. MO_188.B34]MDJ0772367.1 PhoH family protein [Mastigocoleus sp. MO_167.B18]
MANAIKQIELPDIPSAIALSGSQDANLKLLSQQTGASLVLRGKDLHISGTEKQIDLAYRLVRSLEELWSQGNNISSSDILTARQALDTNREHDLQQLQKDILAKTRRGEQVRAKTFRQRKYIEAMRKQDLTFCIGPAGTGKTFLAVVVAVQALLKNEFEKIILTRPAVEAGEKLGFLPGDLQEKINPYLRPLYDAINEFIGADKLPSLMERGVIEVAPLAYMRGRTLNNAFVIVDEAQNTSPSQIKMVLTRLGFGSRMVVTGDMTQTDLPMHQESGLMTAIRILKNVEGISFCEFSQKDVVRHPLVQRIVAAYERHEK